MEGRVGKVFVCHAKVAVLLRPLGRFTEEVVSTRRGGRTDPVARLTGIPHVVPRFDGEPFPVLLSGELEFGFGSFSRILKPETPLSRSTLVASASGNSTVRCDWVSWRSCCSWVQYRFTLPVVHVFRAPSWSYILTASGLSLLFSGQ